MNYGKLIDGNLVLAPRHYIEGDYQISNPTQEMLIARGYKPITYTDPPSEPDEGYIWVEKWYETDSDILQAWEQILEPDEINAERAMEILFGGDE